MGRRCRGGRWDHAVSSRAGSCRDAPRRDARAPPRPRSSAAEPRGGRGLAWPPEPLPLVAWCARGGRATGSRLRRPRRAGWRPRLPGERGDSWALLYQRGNRKGWTDDGDRDRRLVARAPLKYRHTWPGFILLTALGVLLASLDRKSTRLNSSHEWISYAVVC